MKPEIKERISKVKNGEIPTDYVNRKDIGIAPKDWEIGKMADVLCQKKRIVPKPNNKYWRLGLRSHAKGTFHQLVDDPDEINMDELYEVREDDLIINITFAWEHAVALASKDDAGLLVSHRFPTYIFHNNNCPQFYAAVVRQNYFKKLLEIISPGGAGRNRVMSKSSFMKLPCYIPPIAEQKKIAEILSQCDKVIDLKKQLINEKRTMKKWLLENLLNPDSGVRLPGFKGEWQKISFNDLFDFRTSISASRKELGDEGILYLHYGDIHSNIKFCINVENDMNSLPKIDIPKPDEKFLLKDGDIVFVDASEDYDGVSKYVVIYNPDKIPFISGLHTIPARERKSILISAFKRYCFQSYDIKKQFAFYATGMKVLGLNKENLSKIIIKYPVLSEQNAIADILSKADHEIELLEQELEQWKLKKKSLMQLLLSGLVRVNV